MENQLTLSSVVLLEKAKQVFSTLDITEGTRNDYERSVRAFVEYVAVNPLTSNTFLEFKQYLRGRKDIGVSSKNKYLISARVLLRELSRTGSMPDITQNVRGFNQGRKHKKDGLDEVEIGKLFEAMRSMPDNFVGLRFKAIISLLVFQGLRQKEVIGLDVSHIDLNRSVAQITGKGRDDFETIPLHPETIKAVGRYMSVCGIKDGALFFGRGSERLCSRSLRRLVTNQLMTLGIFKSTHGFRHFFMTRLVESFKGDLLKVIEISRHKSIEMVRVYNDSALTSKSLPQYYDAFKGVAL